MRRFLPVFTGFAGLFLGACLAGQPPAPPTLPQLPASSAKGDTQALTPPPKTPARASQTPLGWEIIVQNDEGKGTVYEPSNGPQMIPIPEIEWRCGQSGLKVAMTDEGVYIEGRNITCQLPSGQTITGRTICSRQPDGTVKTDLLVMELTSHGVSRVLALGCGEDKEAEEESAEAPAKDKPGLDLSHTITL